jgi:dinuclear metal center YbgI/SA1388 family protein
MLPLSAILDHLEKLAPTRTAADWDNVGLLLGERDGQVSRLMTCLTVTLTTAQEAIARKAELIVAHHPILFAPARRLTSDTPEGKMLLALARAGVAVYSPHTAFDNAPEGINALLARKLGLEEVRPLRPGKGHGAKTVKLVVFVPEADLASVSEALFAAGAGQIGEYAECSFRLAGTGTFRGSEASNPTVGKKGRREEVHEVRLEMVCPESRLPDVLAALRQAHSYEEPAFDLYALTVPPGAGEGRVGHLPQPTPLAEVAGGLRRALKCGPVQVVGDAARPVSKVAIVCGAGGGMMSDAMRARADVFVTGEMRYHDTLAADAAGMGLILPGHHATERCGVEDLAERLRATWPALDIWASETEADPVMWV